MTSSSFCSFELTGASGLFDPPMGGEGVLVTSELDPTAIARASIQVQGNRRMEDAVFALIFMECDFDFKA